MLVLPAFYGRSIMDSVLHMLGFDEEDGEPIIVGEDGEEDED